MMKKTTPALCSVASVFVLVLLSTTSVSAQIGRFSGTVTDENGEPVVGASVEIQRLDASRKYKPLKTDKRGRYIHAGVPVSGVYRLVVKAEGFRSDFVQNVRPSFDTSDRRGVIDFQLQAGAAGLLAFEVSDEDRERMRRENEAARKKAAKFADMKGKFDEGLEAYNLGEYEIALTAFQGSSEQDPEQQLVWAHLGNTYEKLKRFPEAVEAYQKAIAIDPEDPAFHQNLGNIYSQMGDQEQAIVSYSTSAELSALLDPGKASATYYNMAVTFINARKSRDAVPFLEKAVEFDSANGPALYQLGLVLLNLNRVPESVDAFEKFIEVAGGDPDVDAEDVETAKALVESLGSQ